MTKRRFSDEQARTLAEEYASGMSYPELAAEYGGTDSSVRKAVLRVGGRTRAPARKPSRVIRPSISRSESLRTAVRDEYEAGAQLKDLAAKYGYHPASIAKVIKRAGGTMRSVGRPTTWTAEAVAHAHSAHAGGASIAEIARQLGFNPGAVRQRLRRDGVWTPRPFVSGPDHPQWRGGRQIVSGYVYLKPSAEDLQFATPNSQGYVAEHRLVMGRSIGRPLLASETVHHKNGLRDDNRLENLQLRQGKHGNGSRWVCRSCGSDDVAAKDL